MKKFTLFTFLFLITMRFAFAQIPNSSFETWRAYTGTFGSGSLPTGWWTSDSTYIAVSSGTAGHTVVQEMVNKCDANFGIKLSTISTILGAAPGVATNGSINGITLSSITGGSPDVTRHLNFKGCYAYTEGGAGNIAIISAFLLKRNGATRDTIAFAVLNPTPAASMTSFTVPFVYKSAQTPDSIVVLLSSSPGIGGSSVAGSILYVDSLGVSGIASGIGTIPTAEDFKIYPTLFSIPNNEILNIEVLNPGKYGDISYDIIDALGRVALSGKVSEKLSLHTVSLSNGTYMVSLRNSAGDRLHQSRIVIRHL